MVKQRRGGRSIAIFIRKMSSFTAQSIVSETQLRRTFACCLGTTGFYSLRVRRVRILCTRLGQSRRATRRTQMRRGGNHRPTSNRSIRTARRNLIPRRIPPTNRDAPFRYHLQASITIVISRTRRERPSNSERHNVDTDFHRAQSAPSPTPVSAASHRAPRMDTSQSPRASAVRRTRRRVASRPHTPRRSQTNHP